MVIIVNSKSEIAALLICYVIIMAVLLTAAFYSTEIYIMFKKGYFLEGFSGDKVTTVIGSGMTGP